MFLASALRASAVTVLVLAAACAPSPTHTVSADVRIETLPAPGPNEFCFGFQLVGLRVELQDSGEVMGRVVDANGRFVDHRLYRLIWPAGYTAALRDGRVEILDHDGNNVAGSNEVLLEPEVCKTEDVIRITSVPFMP
jgi:hypothetical protein